MTTFRQLIDQYQYQCCLNVYYDSATYTDADLEDIAAGHCDPVYRHAAAQTLARRVAAQENMYTLEGKVQS